jgi:serine/threonine protein kinase
MSDERQPHPEEPAETLPMEIGATLGEGIFDLAAAPVLEPALDDLGPLFPQYEALRPLGRGGMGVVYQARQKALNRLVALKVLPLGLSADPDFVARFQREAHALARLNHPNVVAIYDSGQTTGGQLYIVMEFVEGTNLHHLIHGSKKAAQPSTPPTEPTFDSPSPLPPAEALAIAAQVCDALAYAHGEGIIHRDIKPANILVDRRGRVKVADFGLARLIGDESADVSVLTQTGAVMGTFDYMAPEQRQGARADHRADIYAVGVMLYEMLCREVPRGIFIPPSKRSGCHACIDPIVAAAMQSAPESRYQSTQEMRAAIESARSGVAIARAAAQSTPLPGKKVLLVVTICVAMAAITGDFFLWPAWQRDALAARPSPTESGIESDQWVDGLAAWWANPGNASLGILSRTAEGSRTEPASNAHSRNVVWVQTSLRDGAIRASVRKISNYASLFLRSTSSQSSGTKQYHAAFNRDGTVAIILLGDHSPQRLADFPAPVGFSPEGSHTLEFRAKGSLLSVAIDGKTTGSLTDTSYSEGSMAFSGDPGTIIEKLEYRELQPATNAPAIQRLPVIAPPPMSGIATKVTKTGVFTLSDKAIMALDDTETAWAVNPPRSATLTARRQRPGGGVELDIHFPSTEPRDSIFDLTSNEWSGARTFAGLNVSPYNGYSLKFTILAADGSRTASPELTVGGLIGPVKGSDALPNTFVSSSVSLGLSSTPSGTSFTGGFAPKTSSLGLRVSLYRHPWPAGPHDVTVLVQAADDATPLPQ